MEQIQKNVKEKTIIKIVINSKFEYEQPIVNVKIRL